MSLQNIEGGSRLKRIGILILCLFILQACKENNSETKDVATDSTNDIPQSVTTSPQNEVPSIQLDRSQFHSIIGWLSDDEILFILTGNGEWTVQSYKLSSESWRTIYTSKIPIIQGVIHPGKEMILLHTSSNSSTAEIQLIHKNGSLEQSLTLESAEIFMNWHPTNPNLIVFSAFYEDWTYNTFIYDGSTQNLTAIEVENPFVKWYDDDHLVVSRWGETSLDGSELFLYSIPDEKMESIGLQHVLDVQNLGDTMLYIQINEKQQQFQYRLENKDSGEAFEWFSPAISNYSEWVVPNMSIVQQNQLIAVQPIESGNVDEHNKKSVLSSISINGESKLGEIDMQPIDCSPNGEVCLGGYEKEKWIQLNPLKEQSWIELKE